MTLLYTDPRFLGHRTGDHPENPSRLEHIVRFLDASGLAARCERPAWQPALPGEIAGIHDPAYIDEVVEFIRRGGGQIESDTVVGPGSLEAALLAAGAVRDAVGRVVKGEDKTALCLVRPPGHHARPAAAMGFCLFNNVAIGARTASSMCSSSIVCLSSIGRSPTTATARKSPLGVTNRSSFMSIHRFALYPGTGRGGMKPAVGRGLASATLNLPVRFGTPRADYLTRFTDELNRFADRIQPHVGAPQ